MHSMSLYGAMGAALKTPTQPKVKNESLSEIGGSLRDARLRFNLTIESVAAELLISPQQIEALEKGDWSKLPAEVYARGYLRRYSDYLGFDSATLLQKLTPAKITLELVQTPVISRHQIDSEVRILCALIALVFVVLMVAVFYHNKTETKQLSLVRPVPSHLTSYIKGHSSEAINAIPECLQGRLRGEALWQCYIPIRFEAISEKYQSRIMLSYFQ
jgi:transcriptional regulator with XRE-family HTH domain